MASLLVAAVIVSLLGVSRARAAHGPGAVSWRRTGLLLGGLATVAVLMLDWWDREDRAAGRADARLDRALHLGGDPS